MFTTSLKILAAALVGAVVLATAGVSYAETGDPSLVETSSGSLRGTVTEGHRTFLGIPYATPPVGDLRWRATEPVEPWTGIRDATEPGSMCPQADWQTGNPVAGSEDCLYLNVDAPLDPQGPVPVMVYLHGGGLISGQGATYDPTRIVEGSDVIVVTANYRLGALGFLAHPDLDDPYAGNFGLADQQEALRWVEENIADFGGDPGNVTLWGQSGGANAVCAQLAAPGAAALFDKAIVQSASCANTALTVEEAESRGTAMANELGCTDAAQALECLYEADLADFVPYRADEIGHVTRYRSDYPWFPVAGTEALPTQPLEALRSGAAADVPLIHGSTKDEARLAVAKTYVWPGNPVTAAQYPDIIEDLFGARDTQRILGKYPLDEFPTPSLALATLLTDYGGLVGTCSQLPALEAAEDGAPVYAYEFAQPLEEPETEFPQGARHGADDRYYFDNRSDPVPPTGDQLALADTLTGHFGTFAWTGDPGGGWDEYRRDNATSFAVDTIEPIRISEGHHCGFWIPRL
ncbi:carboxylesterase/lipase family protein [Glycomyces buryatensis]|uniref:Carboxylic ester hydrolase n=1 Tax=Glycomyces buryatensis TaxID=2570927 RepID=A0A4S8Q8X2_9ACTN|nr:carboxylesterase family protein [Glycomyces buryatensis]THV40863.1 carboxylesterase family protein [Glycomyces buryatensis]